MGDHNTHHILIFRKQRSKYDFCMYEYHMQKLSKIFLLGRGFELHLWQRRTTGATYDANLDTLRRNTIDLRLNKSELILRWIWTCGWLLGDWYKGMTVCVYCMREINGMTPITVVSLPRLNVPVPAKTKRQLADLNPDCLPQSLDIILIYIFSAVC